MAATATAARPSSSPSTFASQPLPSVHSLINLSNLEQYLTGIQSRLSSQEQTIAHLQSSLSSSVSLSSFSSFSSSLLAHIDAQDKKLSDMQQRIDALSQHSATLASHSALLSQHSAHIAALPTQAELSSSLSALSSSLSSSVSSLSSSSASRLEGISSSLSSVLSGQSTLTALIADKVDRAELPLLQGVNERVRRVLEEVEDTGVRVNKLEREMTDVKQEVDSKQSSDEAQEAQRRTAEELQEKVSMDWLVDKVLDPLREVQDELIRFAAHDDTMRQIVQEQQELHTRVQTHHTRVSSYSSDVVSTQQKLSEIDAVLSQKLDIAAWERARRDDSKQLDALLLQMTSRTTHDFKVHANYIADLRQLVQEQQTAASHQSDKLAVALKFIDWFTETKLQMV